MPYGAFIHLQNNVELLIDTFMFQGQVHHNFISFVKDNNITINEFTLVTSNIMLGTLFNNVKFFAEDTEDEDQETGSLNGQIKISNLILTSEDFLGN